MITMNWRRMALVGLFVVIGLAAAGLAPGGEPAGSVLALGFTSTPTFTPEAPTETPVPPTATATPVPTIAPQPTQPPAPQPTQPPAPQPTATPVAAPSQSVPKTGSGFLGVVLAGVLVLLLFGARRVRTASR